MPFEPFHYEVHEFTDETGWITTTIHCHGKIISENTGDVRNLVKPLIERGGHIILDFTDLQFLDSSGLGTIVSLKVSSINRGLCKLDLVNFTPRIEKLLLLTNLLELFVGQVPSHLE
jgi:anti-sigma B factor antagonist